MRHNLGYLVTVSAIALCPAAVHASSGAADTFPNLVLALAMILVTAKLGGDIAIRLRQPAVLGELLAGVALGNASFFGITSLGWIRENPGLELLARLGAVLLLFEVGLESTVRDMLKVGWSALLVAIIGIAAPFGLGWLVAFWMLPERGPYVHAFIGAMLTATSVGITARVLKDLDQSQSGEARIILGAAVVDDVLGLVILAVITALIRGVDAGSPMTVGMVAPILLKASAFLVGGLALGIALTPVLFGGAARLHGSGVLLAAALAFCFFLSWAAAATGLAPIVGAYTAGLILEPIHVRKFTQRGEQGLEDLIRPLGSFLIPIFFVQMGLLVDLTIWGYF
jgi:Kef-type K+ transport system membrane component KefB